MERKEAKEALEHYLNDKAMRSMDRNYEIHITLPIKDEVVRRAITDDGVNTLIEQFTFTHLLKIAYGLTSEPPAGNDYPTGT